MKQIVPYRTVQGALKALDNGGRFYNVFTKAQDDVITDSELCKAAGVFSGQARAFGGIVKKLRFKAKSRRTHGLYVETLFYKT